MHKPYKYQIDQNRMKYELLFLKNCLPDLFIEGNSIGSKAFYLVFDLINTNYTAIGISIPLVAAASG